MDLAGPVKSLLSNFKVFSFVSKDKVLGRVPENLLLAKFKEVRDDSKEISCGIVPVN